MAHNAIFASAAFVNKMRETVVSGCDGAVRLSLDHRRAIFVDWCLCMVATIVVCCLFAAILFVVGFSVGQNTGDDRVLAYGLVLVGSYPAICAVLFVGCGIMDVRLIRRALQDVARDIPPGSEAGNAAIPLPNPAMQSTGFAGG